MSKQEIYIYAAELAFSSALRLLGLLVSIAIAGMTQVNPMRHCTLTHGYR